MGRRNPERDRRMVEAEDFVMLGISLVMYRVKFILFLFWVINIGKKRSSSPRCADFTANVGVGQRAEAPARLGGGGGGSGESGVASRVWVT